MTTDTIEYRNKEYKCRWIEEQIGKHTAKWLIAPVALEIALKNGKDEIGGGQAGLIDQSIYWYADWAEMEMEDSELLQHIKGSGK